MFGLKRPVRRARTATLLDRVGLTNAVYRRRVQTYSKGERTRLGLALALIAEPRVLLLDEPTDGLDPVGRRAIRDLLRELCDEGRSLLLNSHLLAEVEACCDRIVILKAGQVVAQGSTAELLARRRIAYTIRLAEPASEELLTTLRAQSVKLDHKEGVLNVGLETSEAIDGLVDTLRAAGASIRELRPQATLEDVFLELVAEPPPVSP